MLNLEAIRTRPRILRQLTGLTPTAFRALPGDLERAHDDDRQRRDRRRPTPRRRRPGGGAKGVLSTPADTLVFPLSSFRRYPTREVLAFPFGFSQGRARQWIHRLTPLVNRAPGHELHSPARRPAPLQEVLRARPDLEFLIDGPERPIRATGEVVGLGPTHAGGRHDEGRVDGDGYVLPEGGTLYKDTGFQGYEPEGVRTHPPRKKPRGKELTPDEKESNRLIPRVRARVEHGIGGVKVLRIVADTFRNIREGFVDLVMETARGLFNIRLASRARA